MKKYLSLGAAVVVLLGLAGCGKSAGQETKKLEMPPSSAPTTEAATQPPTQQEAELAETVILDRDGIKITATGLDPDSFWGAELKLLIENQSGQDLTFQCRNASVNGFMVEAMLSAEVADGKQANETIAFLGEDLDASGITQIGDMEFSLHIFTAEDMKTYLDTEPIALRTSIADSFTQIVDDSGQVVYEAGGIKIVVRGPVADATLLGPGIGVYIENNSSTPVTCQTRSVSVNGFMLDAIFSAEALPGMLSVDTISFLESDLEDHEISVLERAEVSFHLFNSDTWETLADTDSIHIPFL